MRSLLPRTLLLTTIVLPVHAQSALAPSGAAQSTTTPPAVEPAPPQSTQTPKKLAARVRARDYELVFQAALSTVAPSIVRIDTIGGIDAPDETRTRAVAGFRIADGPTTGVIWSADGYIITSSFNFIRDPSVITVRLADGRRLVAKLVARDKPSRLALLKVNADDLPTPQLRATDTLRVGEPTLVAGYGHGTEQPALTAGILSARARFDGRAFQHDAKCSPANYGGPVFDLDGRLLGIAVPFGPGENELAGVRWYDSGISFAIPTDRLRARVPRLIQTGDLERGLLGLAVDTTVPIVGESTPNGLIISAEPVGPARDAGLERADRIIAVNDQPTLRLVEFRRALARHAAGDTIKLTYIRDSETNTVSITLAPPSAFDNPDADNAATSPPINPESLPDRPRREPPGQ